ncbi:golvesin C-terminal-like domain-containing protein [Streptomyces sp. NPDC002516]
MLGKGWKSSQDLAWTTSGDADGFHLLTAAKSAGYAWKNLATLAEPGFDADSWIGNACVTGSGRQAVVVYAPRTFTNKPDLMARGGFTAVVDLTSGSVRKLPVLTSLSYYNPGCGAGETAVLTQSGTEGRPGTRLLRLDARTGRTRAPVLVKGQVTSAVPGPAGTTLAARGAQIVSLGATGHATTVARTDGVPFRLTPDAHGGLLWLDHHGGNATARHLGTSALARPDAAKARPATVATGPLTRLGVTRSEDAVYVTGPSKASRGAAPAGVGRLPAVGKDAQVSTLGTALVSPPRWADGKGTMLQPGEPDAARPVDLDLTLRASGRRTTLRAVTTTVSSPHAAQGRALSPGLVAHAPKAAGKRASAAALSSSPTDPVEDERTCSVPRNDPANQAMQPKPRQVEWAVDQAVQGYLNTHISRPANWKNLGMPAYSPQSLFLNPVVNGGGRAMAQVMLGVATQESNMWQAGREAVPGVTANPLIGNYYGIDLYDGDTSNDWDINFAKADCGYGITQVTDHMRLAGREDGHGGAAWDYQKQRAVALDYTANIAAGLQILVSKWNETRAAGLIANHGTPGRPENWYFALWAYNSGFHPDKGDGSPWGLGWANNPANPEWDAGRLPFMENAAGGEDASAAAHPQNWPYQEKVLGFAGHPPSFLESPGTLVPAFRPASWNGTNQSVSTKGSALYNRAHLKAPEDAFCDPTSDDCFPGRISDSATNANGSSGPCGREDLMCWWHKPVTWKTDCVDTCGYEFLRFSTSMPEEADGTAYPPACGDSGLPANAVIVDDVPTNVQSIRPNCPKYWDSRGTFTLHYSNNGTETVYPGKADTHQLGAGFGGHFYFTHTRQDDAKGQRLKVVGTWKPDVDLKGQAKIMVHLPDHGAQTTRARYEIDTALGTETRIVSQAGTGNRWVSLGVFRLNSSPEVRLSSITDDGTGDEDIAFDAVAFVPGTYDVPGAVPDIRLPQANPNAPEPADEEPITVLPGGPFAQKAASALRGKSVAAGSERSCTPVKGKKNTEICIGPAASTPKGALARPRTAASGTTSFCSANSANRFFTRTTGCLQSLVDVQQIVDGSVFATWTFQYRHELDLNVDSEKFTQTVSLTPYRADPKMAAVSVDITPSCSPNCTTGAVSWSSPNVWATAADGHTATATVEQTWTGTSGNDRMKLDWTLSGKIEGKETSTISYSSNEMAVRCDREAKGTRSAPGCVFPEYTPTYVVNTEQNPSAAAFYWTLMQRLPSHPGSRDHNAPLNYLAAKARQTANREVICPKSGPDKWVGNPVSAPSGTTSSCDEYPFAATYQSGGMPPQAVDNGKQCTQLYASPLTGGGWTLLEDTTYSRVNTWDEICGRASIPGDENSGAANRIGLFFVPKNRMIDKDKFFVSTPGFEECTDLTKICWVRTRS